MRSMMIAALMVFVGCAAEAEEGAELMEFPDRVEGTFTQNGMTVEFVMTPDRLLVRAPSGELALEETLVGGKLETRVGAGEAALVAEQLRVDLVNGTIACPPAPKPRWWQVQAQSKTPTMLDTNLEEQTQAPKMID